jgi:3-methylfumaryl-CoA hydratase
MDHVERTDRVDLDRARALGGLLDLDPATLVEGDLLRPMWQLVYFLQRPAQAALGPDGHPLDEFPSPPRPGLRRMFAGGRLSLEPGLRIGETATARTAVKSARERQGRAGRLTFVTTQTVVSGELGPCLVDERDIVYLESAPSMTAARGFVDEPTPAAATSYVIDETLLFRFSALTYNAHRIHYDRDYARSVEGYPGLVVHGPLQALLMAETASAVLPGGVHFAYQLVAPLFEGHGLDVSITERSATAVTVEVGDSSGRVTARGVLSAGQ